MNREQIKRLIKAVDRFTDVFLGHILPVQLTYFFTYLLYYDPILEENVHDSTTITISLLMILPLFFSLVRTATVYDRPLREAYLASPAEGFKGKLTFWFRQTQFWVETAVFAGLYLLLPIHWTSAVLVDVFCGGNTASKAKLLAVYLPMLFLLHLLARLSAMQVWTDLQRGKNVNRWRLEEKRSMTKRLVETILVYAFCGTMLSFSLPILAALLPFLKKGLTVTVILLLALLLLTPTVFRSLRAFRKRRAFVKRFIAVCKERGYSATAVRYPYRSLFFLYRGEDFRVTVGEKQFACKLLCAKNKRSPLALYANGICQYARIVRLLTVELFQYDKVGKFGFEADCPKVLILNPVPLQVVKFEGSKAIQLDNGDIVGDYKIFSATAFLNALERDVLDR
ncbi:MAG: hypothetical protein J1E00_04995 [Oscillospiraceae bacterium]|nr:hypothetical protein [Oscillospiraceae bacterium]